MTSTINNSPAVQVPAGAAKKTRVARRTSSRGIFGLLPDWKIDTQAFRDEMRN